MTKQAALAHDRPRAQRGRLSGWLFLVLDRWRFCHRGKAPFGPSGKQHGAAAARRRSSCTGFCSSRACRWSHRRSSCTRFCGGRARRWRRRHSSCMSCVCGRARRWRRRGCLYMHFAAPAQAAACNAPAPHGPDLSTACCSGRMPAFQLLARSALRCLATPFPFPRAYPSSRPRLLA